MDTTQEQPPVTVYRWLVIGLWLVCSVTGFMVAATIGIMLPAISSDLGLSPGQQGMLGSSAFWGNVALAVPLSWWTARYGPKILTTVTLTAGTALIFLQSWAPSFAILLAGRMVFGVSVIARQPAQAILTQQWFRQREIVMVNSLSNALFGMVVGGGLAGSPIILDSLGDDWRTTFRTFGILFTVLTVLWAVLGSERRGSSHREHRTGLSFGALRQTLSYRDLWIVGIGFVGATGAWSAFLAFYPTLMLDVHQMSLKVSGGALALGVLLGGASGLAFGYAVMTSGRGNTYLKLQGVLMASTYVAMTLTGNTSLVVLLSFLNGIAWGFWPILYTVPFHLPGIRPQQVPVALAFTLMMVSTGTALGPLVTGFMQEAFDGLKWPLFIVGFSPLTLTMAGTLLPTLTGGRTGVSRAPTTEAGATD